MTPDYWDEAKEYLSNADSTLEKIISEYEGEGLYLKGDAFQTLARAIIGQQISVKAADSVWNKYNALTNSSPQKTLELEHEELRSAGLSNQKANYLKNIAEFMLSHDGNWHDEDEEAVKQLCTIKGVGSWTAEMFLMFHLGRQDLFPIKDLGLIKAIEKHYDVPRDELIEFSKKWQPYRTVATWYLWRSLDPHPVEY